ncbi:MAG: beta-galactosidase [Sedimentisphaerales bacterium]|nr:beta-galactosidase [Sedimentisphaerales bacterium]
MKRRAILAGIVVSCWLPVAGLAQTAAAQGQPVLAPGRSMFIGVDYYPEHWPRERWETDARLMKEAGFNVVRLAEFAWIDMEPQEGQYDFSWLDDAIKLLARYDINVILGTPTAVMPAWLARKYPEALRMKTDGTRVVWGGRKNNCYSNRDYRLLSERITLAMAAHFARQRNVIGWQIDNEFGGEECFCPSCLARFQFWLQRKYGTLDELNRAWGNRFWGLKFTAWDQITIPDCATDRSWVMGNPSACLDWKRFITQQQARFQTGQVAILRELCPDDFITHNFMGLFSALDYYEMARDLDFVSWDNYPIWSDKPNIPYDASLSADVMRGLKRKNFMIMEQTAGPCGWESFGRNPWPGEIRKIAYQQLAHGSDGQIWFRWRTCTVGREQYWHGLLGHDGEPLRRYKEAAQTAKEFRRLEGHLRGTTVMSDVAIVYDYDNLWSLSFQPGFAGNSLQNAIRRYYNAIMRAGVNVDIVSRQADLSPYKLVLAPDLSILPDETARKLDAYVKDGGVLLADCRTGVKDEFNLCHDRTLPGLLSEPLGITIEEYSSLGADSSYRVVGDDGLTGTAIQYVDWVKPQGAKALAGYIGQWHMQPFAAVTRNEYGKGKGWYVGAVISEDDFYDALIDRLLKDADVRPSVVPPAGVEASLRQGQGKSLLFLINHTDEPRRVKVPKDKLELLNDKRTQGIIDLDRFGVAVIEL